MSDAEKGITGTVVRNFDRQILQRTIGKRWTLSKDGKTLTIERRDNYPVFVPNIGDAPRDSQYMQTYSANKFVFKRG